MFRNWVPRPIVEWRHGGWPLRSWEEAVAAAGSYDAEVLNRFRAERAALRVSPGTPAGGLLPLVVRALGGADLAIVDFGGATGEEVRALFSAFPAVQATVVENPTLVALMTPGPVYFTTEIPESCDVFYSSSALPYIRDQIAILDRAFGSARKAVVLVRNSFSPRKIYRAQRTWLFHNGSGPLPPGYSNVRISYPHQTLDEHDVIKIASKRGFRCVARLEEHSGVLPYRDLVYGKQLVFFKV